MDTILDQSKISDTISMGAEFEASEGEVALYFASPEMSSSLAMEEEEWAAFKEKVEEIDRAVEF